MRSLADEQGQLTEQLLQDAIAVAGGGVWTGSPSDAAKAAATEALERLQRQLDIQTNFMDGYLRAAIALPLAPGDANATTLEECCLALARCGINDDSDNATERMDECCKGWRKWLLDVQAGRVQLVTATGETPASGGRVRSGQAVSGSNWGVFP